MDCLALFTLLKRMYIFIQFQSAHWDPTEEFACTYCNVISQYNSLGLNPFQLPHSLDCTSGWVDTLLLVFERSQILRFLIISCNISDFNVHQEMLVVSIKTSRTNQKVLPSFSITCYVILSTANSMLVLLSSNHILSLWVCF